MKLHDAMRKTVREYGVRVIAEKRLIFILADLRAFEEYPAVKPVLEAVVSGGAGKELCRLFLDDDHDGCLSYARGSENPFPTRALSGAILLFTRWAPYSSRSGSLSLSRSLPITALIRWGTEAARGEPEQDGRKQLAGRRARSGRKG